jgi:hypothetical protein
MRLVAWLLIAIAAVQFDRWRDSSATTMAENYILWGCLVTALTAWLCSFWKQTIK